MRAGAISLMVVVLMGGRGSHESTAAASLPPLTIPIRFEMPAVRAASVAPGKGGQTGYQPVAPIPYKRKCGTIATDVCPTDIAVPPGASGEQLFQMAAQAEQQGRKSDALSYLLKSADKGYVRAQAAVGIDYADGKGLPRDMQKAVQYLELAAAQGSRGAEAKLGEIYENGDGVAADQTRALEYYRSSAAQHDTNAEFALGVAYEFGNGVAHDRALAIQYLRQSSVDGHDTNGTELANALAKVPASRRFQSFNELFAYLHPPAPPRSGGQCGGTPTLFAGFSRWGTSQIISYCTNRSGCPYTLIDGGIPMHCP
jgi:hypothetical protein